MPSHVLSQRKRITPAIVLDCPALRELRDWVQVLIEPDKAVENLIGDRVRVARRRHRRIQRTRIAPLRNDKRGGGRLGSIRRTRRDQCATRGTKAGDLTRPSHGELWNGLSGQQAL